MRQMELFEAVAVAESSAEGPRSVLTGYPAIISIVYCPGGVICVNDLAGLHPPAIYNDEARFIRRLREQFQMMKIRKQCGTAEGLLRRMKRQPGAEVFI